MNARLLGLALLLALGACGSRAPTLEPGASATNDTGLDRMERLTLTANRCWISSGDPAFARYSLAPELSSFSGRPRFLLVPRGRPEERPLLVVEGRDGSAAIETYGPLMQANLASRIRHDIERWGAGSQTCAA